MSDPSEDKQTISDPGWHELVDDAFGINLKGLKTIWASITAPAGLFSAACTIDWQGQKYSPTLRVWLFLITVLMFLQFIWANPDSIVGQQMKSAFDAYGDTRLTARETIEIALQRYVFVYPILLMLLSMLAALLPGIWGRPMTAAVRIRTYFATILPGLVVTLLSTPLTLLISGDNMAVYVQSMSIVMVLVFLADFITAHRGLAPTHKVSARTLSAMLLAIINAIVYLMASTIAATIMIFLLIIDMGKGM